MRNIKIAVVSDLHCHSYKEDKWDSFLHYDVLPEPVNNHPIQSLLELIDRKQLSAQALLVPGDIANKIDKAGILFGWRCIQDVSSKLGAKLVAVTLGNHDVDSHKIHKDCNNPFEIAKKLKPQGFPFMDKTTDVNLDKFFNRGFCLVEEGDLQVLVVNSVSAYSGEPCHPFRF